jgi:cysteine desulfurase
VAALVYLDHHATTPVDPRVLDEMRPYLERDFGNPASRQHVFGARAREAVDLARARVAALIGADPREIVFTSGATEAANLALKGAWEARGDDPRTAGRDRIVTQATEHPAVLGPLRALERRGARVEVLPVDAAGRVDPAALEAAVDDRTLLLALMWANNEVGTIQPVAEAGRICRARGVLLFTDATQAVGKIPVDVAAANVDLLGLSAHKVYGPKGAGALFVRRRTRLAPLIDGGGHERGLRSGTPNVPGVVGLGRACEIAQNEMAGEAARLAALRDRLWAIVSALDGVRLNGPPVPNRGGLRLPGNLNVTIDGVEAESLMTRLPDVAISSGAACATADRKPSHVLRAMGLDEAAIVGSVRFGLGRPTTPEEVEAVGARVVEEVRRLRRMTPVAAR